tara:strand:+ start:2215 stop:2952 length:738 start_codon:yes stop_codon:yes gene_type:complete
LKKHLLEYHEFINPLEKLSISLSKSFMTSIKKFSTVDKYTKLVDLEINEEFIKFDICLIVKNSKMSPFKDDPYFKGKTQALVSIKTDNYVITGNTFINGDDIPLIEIILYTNGDFSEESLYFKLNNVISHEINHLKQVGWNRDSFNFNPDKKEHKHNRQQQQRDYRYFMLPEEIESIVYGMENQSRIQKVPIDTLFDDYLDRYVKSKFMSTSNKSEIIKIWILYTLKYHPLAKLSGKYTEIINNI